jgi:hypothetical protein
MTFPRNPHKRLPRGDLNRRLSLGMTLDEMAAEANVTPEKLREYEHTNPAAHFNTGVARLVGEALERLESTRIPLVDNGPVPIDNGASARFLGAMVPHRSRQLPYSSSQMRGHPQATPVLTRRLPWLLVLLLATTGYALGMQQAARSLPKGGLAPESDAAGDSSSDAYTSELFLDYIYYIIAKR